MMTAKEITYGELFTSFKRGMRNGNWRKLKFLDKALYRAAMRYARYGRSIVNGLLVEKLLGFIAKLLETSGARVLSFGWGRYGEKNAKCKSQIRLFSRANEIYIIFCQPK